MHFAPISLVLLTSFAVVIALRDAYLPPLESNHTLDDPARLKQHCDAMARLSGDIKRTGDWLSPTAKRKADNAHRSDHEKKLEKLRNHREKHVGEATNSAMAIARKTIHFANPSPELITPQHRANHHVSQIQEHGAHVTSERAIIDQLIDSKWNSDPRVRSEISFNLAQSTAREIVHNEHIDKHVEALGVLQREHPGVHLPPDMVEVKEGASVLHGMANIEHAASILHGMASTEHAS